MSDSYVVKLPSPNKRITWEEFGKFASDYFIKQKYPHQRYGQAFVNTYNLQGDEASALFYEEDVEEARKLIAEFFITEFENDDPEDDGEYGDMGGAYYE